MAVATSAAWERWESALLTGEWPTSKNGRALSMEGTNVIGEMDVIYSYGRHFPLAEVIRNKDKSPRVAVLNGDLYSNTTSGHQRAVRGIVERSGVDYLIVPFSALDAASIDRKTIQIVETRPDRNEEIRHESEERPGPLLEMDDPSGATFVSERTASGTLDSETGLFYERITRHYGYGGPDPFANVDDEARQGYAVWTDGEESPEGWQWIKKLPEESPNILQDREGWSKWSERWKEHTTRTVPYRKPVRVPNPEKCYVGRSTWVTATRHLEPGRDWVWRWTTTRHWLGDSCFRAKVTETTEKIEWGPVVSGWREAHDKGWTVTRRRGNEIHAVNAEVKRKTRWAYFLSSFDYQEARPLYFLCELPRRSKPTSVDHAYELLKPPEVVAGEAEGRVIARQGDVFGVETDLTTKEIKAKLRRGEIITKRRHVLGTEHSCSEVALCKGGEVYGRGLMYHDVGTFRERDHARRKMGDGKKWFRLIRNTVPRAS